jgi:hypothetical protein
MEYLVRFSEQLRQVEKIIEVLPLLLAGAGIDPTHVSIDTAALALGVSVPTIRRRIRNGDLPLHVIPGTKVSGIPVDALFGSWIPIRVARAALARERATLRDADSTKSRTKKAVRG